MVAPRVVLRLAPGTLVEESPAKVRLARRRAALSIHQPPSAVRSLIARLASGAASEADLIGASVAAAAELRHVLAALEERGLLGASVPFIVDVEPLRGAVRVMRARAPSSPALSGFACLRPEGAGLALESPLATGRAVLHGRRGCALAGALATGETGGLDVDERAAVALLAAAGLLADKDEKRQGAQAWEWHDLLFHAETRGWSDGRPRGGTYRLRGVVDPPPDARPQHGGRAVELQRADLEALAVEDVPFGAVLERRRSERRFDDRRPVTVYELGLLLDRSAARRVLFTSEGIECSRRPSPSGGGLAALELYPVVHRCEGLDSGVYHYEADAHRLRLIGDEPPELELPESGHAPQVTLAVAVRHERIAWKYERIAYQLALLDLGVLYQTIWLTATAMGLGGYPLGSLDAARFASVTDLDPLEEAGLGAFILGRPERTP